MIIIAMALVSIFLDFLYHELVNLVYRPNLACQLKRSFCILLNGLIKEKYRGPERTRGQREAGGRMVEKACGLQNLKYLLSGPL